MLDAQESESFLQVLNIMGMSSLSPVQEKALPALLAGQSIRMVAPTGCGKTLAFLLPLVEQLKPEVKTPQLLVLVPSRELAQQVAKVARQLNAARIQAKGVSLGICLVAGGEDPDAQKIELAKGPHIVVATPGRIQDLIDRDLFEPRDLSYVVVDEFDQLLTLGFESPLERVLSLLPKGVQFCLASATDSELPETLAELMPPDFVEISLEKKQARGEDTVDQHVLFRISNQNPFEKAKELSELLKSSLTEDGLIFCQMKETAHRLCETLQSLGLSAEVLSGDLGQIQRNTVLRRFRTKGFRFLVTTNVLSRGIDLKDLGISINFDLPQTLAEYQHRAGRTGRAGNPIFVLSLVHPSEETQFRQMLAPGKIIPKQFSLAKLQEKKPVEAEEAQIASDLPAEKNPKDFRNFGRIHLNRGKTHKIRPGDVLGGILKMSGVQSQEVGSIFIYDHFTHVDVAEEKIAEVLAKLNNGKIKNLSIKASLASS